MCSRQNSAAGIKSMISSTNINQQSEGKKPTLIEVEERDNKLERDSDGTAIGKETVVETKLRYSSSKVEVWASQKGKDMSAKQISIAPGISSAPNPLRGGKIVLKFSNGPFAGTNVSTQSYFDETEIDSTLGNTEIRLPYSPAGRTPEIYTECEYSALLEHRNEN